MSEKIVVLIFLCLTLLFFIYLTDTYKVTITDKTSRLGCVIDI